MCAVIFLTSVLARAEPSPADIESARGLYVEGLELRDRGERAQSLQRFRDAHSLAATPITSLELGHALVLVGRLLDAREVLLSIERLAVRADESQKAANARMDARVLAEQLKGRIPAVRVYFSPPTPALPRVTIDGTALPPEVLSTTRKLDPGKHLVVAELDGARATAAISLAEAEVQTVTLTLAPAPRVAGAPERADPARAPSGGLGALFYGGIVTAAAGVAVGSFAGVVALSKAGSLADECSGVHCPRSAENDLSTSKTMGTVSTVAFAVAGAGAVIAVVTWLTRPATPPAAPMATWLVR